MGFLLVFQNVREALGPRESGSKRLQRRLLARGGRPGRGVLEIPHVRRAVRGARTQPADRLMATIRLPADFQDFLKLLNSHRVEYLLVGGYAVCYHGF